MTSCTSSLSLYSPLILLKFSCKFFDKKIIQLNEAYEKIFSSQNLHENLSKINGEYKDNELVQEVTNFISKDKKRPICLPLNN